MTSAPLPFDVLVFIGRFSPFHNGHMAVLKKALSKADRVLMLIGSAKRPRTDKNPWNADERAAMIRGALEDLPAADAARVSIGAIEDKTYAEAKWIAGVQRETHRLIRANGQDPSTLRIGIIGHLKDSSSYYLKSFSWPALDVPHGDTLSATEIRQHLFLGDAGALRLIQANVPRGVFEFLAAFKAHASAFERLVGETRHAQDEREQWAGSPHPPAAHTTDAVVVCKGQVLLVRRKNHPGQGLWALPGGFVNRHETRIQAVLRELDEETQIQVPKAELVKAIRREQSFDDPGRCGYVRIITTAYLIELDAPDASTDRSLDRGPIDVEAGDDAEAARWIDLAEALDMSEAMFADHHDILEELLS